VLLIADTGTVVNSSLIDFDHGIIDPTPTVGDGRRWPIRLSTVLALLVLGCDGTFMQNDPVNSEESTCEIQGIGGIWVWATIQPSSRAVVPCSDAGKTSSGTSRTATSPGAGGRE
jgi:hypothetical protein